MLKVLLVVLWMLINFRKLECKSHTCRNLGREQLGRNDLCDTGAVL